MIFRPESIEDLIEIYPLKVQRLAQASRRRILQVVPGAVERLRPVWRVIGYNAPRYFAFIQLFYDHIKIGFEWGVLLPDPAHRLEGTGKQTRFIFIDIMSALRDSAVTTLLQIAAEFVPPKRLR